MTTPTSVSRRDFVDIAFIVVLIGLGLYGFRTSFGGSRFMPVGLVGTAAGIATAVVILRAKAHLLVSVAGALLAFYLFGAVAVPGKDDSIAGVIPNLNTFGAISDGAANGWARLLTSLTPAGVDGRVLVVPYFCGFVAGLASLLLTRRFPRYPVGLIPPIGVLVGSILLGIDAPANVVLQGGVFAAVGIAWICVRVNNRRVSVVGGVRANRLIVAVGLLTGSLMVASAIGGYLPGASANPRLVLRNKIVPPFDPRDYPSPLVSYRANLQAREKNLVMLRAEGLPASSVIRDRGAFVKVAVMDYYDGVVWSVAPADLTKSLVEAGVFRKVGTSIPDARPGTRTKVTIRIGALAGPWVPTVGSPSSVAFLGERADALQSSFRFNRASNVGATSFGLTADDAFVVDATPAPARPARGAFAASSALSGVESNALPEETFAPLKDLIAKVQGDDAAKARILEQEFQSGFYYDVNGATRVAPGHSLAHLINFLSTNTVSGKPVGQAEQYAAAMAVVARGLGMPARVVTGFVNPTSRGGNVAFTGDHAEAWVEINFRGVGWVPYFPTPDRRNTTDEKPEPRLINDQEQVDSKTQVPLPPPRLANLQKARTDKGAPDEDGRSLFDRVLSLLLAFARFLVVPVTLLLAPVLLLAFAKAIRRRRRRTRGSPSERIANGWAEVVDFARDAGRPAPPRLTRLETAQLIGGTKTTELALVADEAAFGALAPDRAAATAYWAEVDTFRKRVTKGRSRRERLRTLASPTSFLVGRRFPKLDIRQLGARLMPPLRKRVA